MQAFPFAPWLWRDPAWVTAPDTGTDHDGEGGEPSGTRLIGYHVEATDGGIGKVDEHNADVPTGCLVVDTGPWIFGRTVVLPVGTVSRVDHDERTIHVDRTKEQIKAAPEYDPDSFEHDDFHDRTAAYYTETYRLVPPML